MKYFKIIKADSAAVTTNATPETRNQSRVPTEATEPIRRPSQRVLPIFPCRVARKASGPRASTKSNQCQCDWESKWVWVWAWVWGNVDSSETNRSVKWDVERGAWGVGRGAWWVYHISGRGIEMEYAERQLHVIRFWGYTHLCLADGQIFDLNE